MLIVEPSCFCRLLLLGLLCCASVTAQNASMISLTHFRALSGVVTCPDGSENKGGGSSLDCVACPCGLFSRDGAACARCPGWRASSDGINCDICAPGYEKKGMYPAGPLCVICPGGFHSSSGYGV